MIKRRINKKLKKIHSIYFVLLSFILMLLINTQCIEEFDPDIHEETNLLSIDGSIVKGREEQVIFITRSTPVDETSFTPVKKCTVSVIDDKGNVFSFEEITPGKYIAKIQQDYLSIGAKFKLKIITSETKTYESSFEEILVCPTVDSVYFLQETAYSIEEEDEVNGLRLYLDLKANAGDTRFYRWNLDETWEFNSSYEFNMMYLGQNSEGIDTFAVFNKYIDSLYYCWHHGSVKGLYSSSTLNLVKNEKKKIPLHHIEGRDIKLYVKYSCLVSQYSLNEGAYEFWHNKKVELQESGGLYTSQPGQSRSNIENIDDEEEVVLGYFWASSVNEKRIFYEGPFERWDRYPKCDLDTFKIDTMPGAEPIIKPAYIISGGDMMIDWTADQECFDCRLSGGTTTRPDFWY